MLSLGIGVASLVWQLQILMCTSAISFSLWIRIHNSVHAFLCGNFRGPDWKIAFFSIWVHWTQNAIFGLLSWRHCFLAFLSRFQEELLNLPLPGIEAVLSSDDLQVASEDVIYDLVLKWARAHYPMLEYRRDVLGKRLCRLIRFPYMTGRKLKKILTCNDFNQELASKVVLEALFFKAEAPYRKRTLAAEDLNPSCHRFIERAYKYRPVKVVEFELPRQQCVVYLDLKREECAHIFPAGRVYSQAFHLGGQGFFLSAHCNLEQQTNCHCFGLFLGMQEKGKVSFAVDYDFSARLKPSEEYASRYKGNYTFTGGKAVGYRNLFGVPWTAFMAEDSLYFINGILHLRAELTIRKWLFFNDLVSKKHVNNRLGNCSSILFAWLHLEGSIVVGELVVAISVKCSWNTISVYNNYVYAILLV